MAEEIDAFVAAWLRDNEAVLLEIVALQGEDPTTPYGAALAAAMAAASRLNADPAARGAGAANSKPIAASAGAPLLSLADEYEVHAVEAERLARTSESEGLRDALARIAQGWRRLETEARRIEARDA